MRLRPTAGLVLALFAAVTSRAVAQADQPARACDFDDVHFHLTNYIQEGISVREFLRIMGTRVCRSALFGIPLQQTWSHENSGDFAPTYYLQSDAPLYYYSFTDAFIAMAYRSLPPEEQARFDPMITGFNPADMYAADHIRRVLRTFPGVFTGIGEFTIHKEFVSSKIAGETASLTDPALDRILDFAGEVGLVVLIHNDMDVPFAKPGKEPVFLSQMKACCGGTRRRRSSGPTSGWGASYTRSRPPQRLRPRSGTPTRSHRRGDSLRPDAPPRVLRHQLGRGRQVYPGHARDHPPRGRHDQPISRPFPVRLGRGGAARHHPVLRGVRDVSSAVGAAHAGSQREGRKGNYERLFDAARRRVRAWEQAQKW